MRSGYVWACCAFLLVATSVCAHSQTVEGDILRGQGAFLKGAGWYNLNTARGNAVNVAAMRNYNAEVRLNYQNRVRYWVEKKYKKDISKQEAAARIKEREDQLRNAPTTDDIQSGEALNMLTAMLTDPAVKDPDWYLNAIKLPEKATVKNLVFEYFPGPMSRSDLKVVVAISQLGRDVDWPPFIKTDDFKRVCDDYEIAVSKVKKSVIAGRVDPKEIKLVDASLDAISNQINASFAADKRGFKSEGLKFFNDLKASTKLFDGANLEYAGELLRETDEYDAKTVGELVLFMQKYRLYFANADRPKSIELYHEVFKSLREQAAKLDVLKSDIGVTSEVDDAKRSRPFSKGSIWKGKAVVSEGAKEHSSDDWTLEITDRDDKSFKGKLTFYAYVAKAMRTIDVDGTIGKSFRIELRTSPGPGKNRQEYKGDYDPASGKLVLRFDVKGPGGKEHKGVLRMTRE